MVNVWMNLTDVSGFLNIPNATTGGWFWSAVLMMLFIILIMALIQWRFEIAMITASFITMIAGTMLMYANLIPWWVFLIPFSTFMFMIIYSINSSTRENV